MKYMLPASVRRYSRLFAIIVYIILLFPLILPLFPSGMIKTYDGPAHLFRIAAFAKAFMEGNIPPGWSSDLAYGWGSPVFLFNWSLPYWFALPFVLLKVSIINALKIVEGMAIPLSFITMYLLLRRWFRWGPALTGALLYCWAPFRMYLLYTCGGLGMEMSFIFWPLAFYAVALAKDGKHMVSFIIGSVSFAALILTHQVMFLMILPLWATTVWTTSKSRTHCLAFLLCGLGLSAYFWLPALAEKQFINIAKETQNIYQRDFLPLKIVLLQPGFFELKGTDDWFKHIYALGWVHIFVPILWIVAYIPALIQHKKKPRMLRIQMLCVVFFTLSIFLITSTSKLLWQYVPLLSSFIYPIRFEALAIFCSSILLAGIVEKSKPRWIAAAFACLIILFINYPSIPWGKERIYWPDSHFYYGDSTSDMTGEFLPQWADASHFFGENRWERQRLARIISGTGAITHMVKKSSSAAFDVSAQTPVTVIINQHYFPGWIIKMENKIRPIQITSRGEMSISVPIGFHAVEANFVATPIRLFGKALSLLTSSLLVLYSFRALVFHKKQQGTEGKEGNTTT